MSNERREEQMMVAAEAYAAGCYADEPVSFSTEENICETINDFCAGWRAADRCSQWIPVEERLPEETEVVLGVREGGTNAEMYKFMGFNESTNTFDWEWHPYYRAIVGDITHWMPLPAPPKEGGDDEK